MVRAAGLAAGPVLHGILRRKDRTTSGLLATPPGREDSSVDERRLYSPVLSSPAAHSL